MIKKIRKKAGAVFLAVMLSLSVMPMTDVFAAGDTYSIDELQEGDILQVGDEIDKGSTSMLGNFVYYKSSAATGKYEIVAYPDSPYTVENRYDNGTWVIVKKSNSSGWYDVLLAPLPVTADITVTNDGNGTASSDVSKASEGDIVTLTAVPNTGYKFKEWQSDDVTVTDNQFTMPNKAVSVKAIFEALPVEYDITINNDGNGTASSDISKAEEGDIVTLTAVPNTGYKFKEWQSDDVTVTDNQFTMPNKAVTVKAIFEAVSVERKATIENVEVKGVVGEALPVQSKSLKVTIQGDKIILKNLSFIQMLNSNLPKGIYVYAANKDTNETCLNITLGGRPYVMGAGNIEITIPGAWLESGVDLKVTSSSNAKYNIRNLEVTAGAGSTHKTGGNEDLTFTCSGSLDNLTGIYVDGALVNPSNYTTKSGSTILTLKAGYLNTLAVGTHTLKFQYKNNMSADTSFEIVKAEDEKKPPVNNPADKSGTPNKNTGKPTSPKTGDTTNISLLMSLLVLSGGAVAFVTKKRKMATKRSIKEEILYV